MDKLHCLICAVSSIVIFHQLFGFIANMDAMKYTGHPLRFTFLMLHWALVPTGALLILIDHQSGGPLLLAGLALGYLGDRRKPHRPTVA